MPIPYNLNENFKKWFAGSKVVNSDGTPMILYHGTQRPDRIGKKFDPKRATSGPMQFFTSDPDIASNYATGKADTSLALEDRPFGTWFLCKVEGGRNRIPIDKAWYHMTSIEKENFKNNLLHIRQDEATNAIIYAEEIGGLSGVDHYNFIAQRECRNNWICTAIELWLSSGVLFDDEEEFIKVLNLAGFPKRFDVIYDSPQSSFPGVFAVYLSIKNPLNTSSIPQNVVDLLEKNSRRIKNKAQGLGADFWDKNLRDPNEWIGELKNGIAKNENLVWTSIPDWVTKTLITLGYDGIQDAGGKYSDTKHSVWIPFYPQQIKSIWNKGTWNSNSKNINEAAIKINTERYPKINNGVVNGRKVLDNIDNLGSIEASLENFEILPGIREIPLTEFPGLTGRHYSVEGNAKIANLARQIRQSNAISPLIVAVDSGGPYILEGATRADALFRLGAKSLPALVVFDLESTNENMNETIARVKGSYEVSMDSVDTTSDVPDNENSKFGKDHMEKIKHEDTLPSTGYTSYKETVTKPELSLTKIDFPFALADKIKEWAKETISKEDLYFNSELPNCSGFQDEIHATIFYGLVGNAINIISKLKKNFSSFGPISLTLGKVSIFENDDNGYDVVVLNVISDDLDKIHYQIRDMFENEETFPDYHPHVTLAFVKKGLGQQYEGLDEFEGVGIGVNGFVFTAKQDGQKDVNIKTISEIDETMDRRSNGESHFSKKETVDLKKVQNIFSALFEKNIDRIYEDSDEVEAGKSEVAWWVSFENNKYILHGPIFGSDVEVVWDTADNKSVVGVLHSHPGNDAEFSEFDTNEGEKVVKETGLPLLLGVIGFDPNGETGAIVMQVEEFYPEPQQIEETLSRLQEGLIEESKDWEGKYQYFLQQKGIDSVKAQEEANGFVSKFERFLKENGLRENPDGTWIFRNILEGNIRWPEDSENVIELLTDFNKAKKSANFNAQKDLLQYKKFPELWAVIHNYYKRGEETSDDILKMPGVTFLNSQKDLKLYEISDAKTMSEIANRGSGWCVKDVGTAKTYLEDGVFYLITKAGKNYVLAHPGSDQIKDSSDDPISFEIAKEIFGLVKAFLPKKPNEDYFVFINFYPEMAQLAAVKRNGDIIKYFKNPSEKVQLVAVQNNGFAIQFLKNPSEKVQLAAIQNSIDAIRHLENPSEEVQIAAVQKYGDAIKYLENPSEKVQLAAVQNNGYAIIYLENPSEEVKLAAVQECGYAIQYVKNPSEKVQVAAVQKYGLAIRHFENPSKEVQIAAVQNNEYALGYLKNPSEEVQIAAVQNNGLAIQYLKNPSEKVQIAAVKQNGGVIRYLKNPSEKVKLAAKGLLENSYAQFDEITQKQINNYLPIINKIIIEYMTIFPDSIPLPNIAPVDQTASSWLGRETVYYGDKTSQMSLQKRIFDDEPTLRRIIAHELIHHYDYILNWVPVTDTLEWAQMCYLNKKLGTGHSGFFEKWAAIFNAKYGPGFVTKISDQSYVQAEIKKPFYVFLKKKGITGDFVWSWSINKLRTDTLAQMKKMIMFPQYYGNKADQFKLVISTNRMLLVKTANVGKNFYVPSTQKGKEILQDLWDNAEEIKIVIAPADPIKMGDKDTVDHSKFSDLNETISRLQEGLIEESKDWGGKYQHFLQQKGIDSFEAEKKASIFIDSFEKFLKENNLKESPDGTWIFRNILEGAIRWPEDSENVIELLTDFNKAKKSGNFNAQKDLLQYKKFPELWAVVNNYYKRGEEASDDILKMPGVTLLNSQKDLKLYEINNAKTMSEIAKKGSGWCVKDLNTAKTYLEDGVFYLITKAGKNYVLAHPGSDQIKNFSDDPISIEIAKEIFGLIKAFLPKVPSEDYFVFLNFYPERAQVAVVKQDEDAIQYLENPSEKVQIAAVKQNGYVIWRLKNPSEEVKLAAVKQNGDVIQYLENPSEKVQIAAMQEDGDAIRYLENPSEEIQIVAVKQDGYAIRYFKNPSEEVQLAAVREYGDAIQYLKNPSEKVKLAAVQNSVRAVRYIENPSEKIQITVVEQSGYAIRYLKNPSEKIQLAAVKQNGDAIQYFKNPSEKVQIAAVKQNGDVIKYLKNPSEKIKQLFKQLKNSKNEAYSSNRQFTEAKLIRNVKLIPAIDFDNSIELIHTIDDKSKKSKKKKGKDWTDNDYNDLGDSADGGDGAGGTASSMGFMGVAAAPAVSMQIVSPYAMRNDYNKNSYMKNEPDEPDEIDKILSENTRFSDIDKTVEKLSKNFKEKYIPSSKTENGNKFFNPAKVKKLVEGLMPIKLDKGADVKQLTKKLLQQLIKFIETEMEYIEDPTMLEQFGINELQENNYEFDLVEIVENVDVISPNGDMFPVELNFAWDYSAEPSVFTSAFCEKNGSGGKRAITINLNSYFTCAGLIKTLKQSGQTSLYSLLMHELTHASEPAPFKNIKQTALPREFRGKDIEGYYNNPHEVRAYMQEIVLYFVSKWKKAHLPTELNRFLAKWKEDLPDNLRQSLHYMTPENRNKIWSAVFRALQNRS